jgi:hypothetical protein
MWTTVLMSIIRRILGGVSASNLKQKSELGAICQETMPTQIYSNRLKHALRKCISAGSVIPEDKLVAKFVFGLNIVIFERNIFDYNADPTGAE